MFEDNYDDDDGGHDGDDNLNFFFHVLTYCKNTSPQDTFFMRLTNGDFDFCC